MSSVTLPISKIVCNITIIFGLDVINERTSVQITKGIHSFKDISENLSQFKDLKIISCTENEVTISYDNVKRTISRKNKATFSEMTQVNENNKIRYGSKSIVFTVI